MELFRKFIDLLVIAADKLGAFVSRLIDVGGLFHWIQNVLTAAIHWVSNNIIVYVKPIGIAFGNLFTHAFESLYTFFQHLVERL